LFTLTEGNGYVHGGANHTYPQHLVLTEIIPCFLEDINAEN